MAAVAKSGTPSPASVLMPATDRLSGLLAGEAIAAGDACRINGADGRVYRSSGAAANANAKVRGFAAMAAPAGEAVTLVTEADWHYGAGMTPGADLFLSAATAGALDDAATTGGTAPIGYVVSATVARLFASRY